MRVICLTTTLTLLTLCARSVSAQEPEQLPASSARSDGRALGAIFADRHAAESALHIHRQVLRMTEEGRFEYLSNWVLPNEDHDTFRLQAGFTPTHPAPPADTTHEEHGVRVPAGGEIVSPAYALIDTASALGRLQQLHEKVAALPQTAAQNQVDQPALLALIEMALGDLDPACTHLEQALAAAAPSANDLETGLASQFSDALLLCVDRAAEEARTSNVVEAPAYQITMSYCRISPRTMAQRHFTAAYNRVKLALQAVRRTKDETAGENTSAQWTPISLLRARYRGSGAPIAGWDWGAGTVENLWSHDEDYLLFRVPLRGNFAVEGNLRTFGWRETQMLVAGRWLGPYQSYLTYRTGTVGGPQSFIRIPPPRLSRMDEFFRYRTTVRDRVCMTWFNGREIVREALPEEHDPWVAIRSPHRSDGGVRDLRITGDPQVPEMLRLSASRDLSGWSSYFDESDGVSAGLPVDVIGRQWQFYPISNQDGEIFGYPRFELPEGCHRESLLTYFRPMLEDGSIEYEFWYEPGKFQASPALDRLCFLLEPDGVKIHWLTDGRFDQTDLSPDNVTTEPANRRGPDQLPLKPNAWNKVRLTLRGDTVDLELNDKLVYQRELEATNQRVFGFFYYADRTGLRVRKISWTGAWPRELPALADQELALLETKELDERSKELTAVFSHDFATDKLPDNRFKILTGGDYIEVKNDGVHARRPGTSGYPNTTIAPRLKVGGDFDITLAFNQFVSERVPEGKCSIMLVTLADNTAQDQSLLLRRLLVEEPRDQQIVQCVRVWNEKSSTRRNYFAGQTVEANAGRLRLARRGDRMYFLFAENDSGQFRIVGENSFPTDDLQLEGVQFMLQTHQEGASTSVIWKSLTIRAETLTGAAVEETETHSN